MNFEEFYYDKFTLLHYRSEIIVRWKEVEKLLPYRSVLGIGSGRAFIEDYLASLGKEVIASDISQVMKDKALKFNKNLKDYQIIDCRSLPFVDNSFEACYSQGLLEHFEDIEEQLRILKEAYRVSSRAIVFAVPAPEYDFAGLGNEFRHSKIKWHNILSREFKNFSIDSYWEKLGEVIILEINKGGN